VSRFVPVVPAVLCALVFASSAHAIYGPAAGGLGADVVSVDRASDEQADAPTSDAAISADGRYVVFQTRVSRTGIPNRPASCAKAASFATTGRPAIWRSWPTAVR
jgi:hypothetical protein